MRSIFTDDRLNRNSSRSTNEENVKSRGRGRKKNTEVIKDLKFLIQLFICRLVIIME